MASDSAYPGPLRDEPLAIELHNTLYAAGGRPVDGLADRASAQAFAQALAARLPDDLPAGPSPARARLVALRGAVRTALHAAMEGAPPDPEALAVLNDASAAAPASLRAVSVDGARVAATVDHHGASRADVVLAAVAASAIELIAGPERERLRACGAPGCVLLFLQDHPRRAWCSNACGNRARQARHYRRVHGGT